MRKRNVTCRSAAQAHGKRRYGKGCIKYRVIRYFKKRSAAQTDNWKTRRNNTIVSIMITNDRIVE